MAGGRTSQLLAVLIDADNAPAKYAKPMFEEIASFGEASVRRFYEDVSKPNASDWSKVQATYGLVPHHQPSYTVRKNASDIALVIDAMDLMHTGRFDGFVLVSSDSDFTRLAQRLREQGLNVYGMGERKTPEAFRQACKRFIYLENLQDAEDAPTDITPASPKRRLNEARQFVLQAINKIDQDDEWFHLGQIGQHIMSTHPDFDTRSYGKSKLSELVKDMKGLEIKRGAGNQTMVRKTN